MIQVVLVDLSRTLLFPKDIGYTGSLNTLASQSPHIVGQFVFNQTLLDYLKKYMHQYRMYVFTSGDIQDIAEIQQELTKVFQHVYSAAQMGISKKDPESYRIIVNQLQVNPQDVVFIDDGEENIEAAREAGLVVIPFTNTEEVIVKLTQLLYT